MGEIIKRILSAISPAILGVAAASIYWKALAPLNNEQMLFGFALMVATLWVTRDRRLTND
nr:hypothetical protein [Brevundimonas naejangsanensis]